LKERSKELLLFVGRIFYPPLCSRRMDALNLHTGAEIKNSQPGDFLDLDYAVLSLFTVAGRLAQKGITQSNTLVLEC
jgi:hypothetical protein